MSGYYDEYYDDFPPPYEEDQHSWGGYSVDDSDGYESYENDHCDRPPASTPSNNNPSSRSRNVAGTIKFVPKKCRTCGNPGHDSRTCAMNKGSTGENKRPKQKSAPSPTPPPKESRSSKPAEERACGACREIGHDRRACPRLIKAADHQKQRAVTAAMQTFMETMAGSSVTAQSPLKSKTKKGVSASAAGPKKQTARKSNPTTLGARGSRGGARVSKKPTPASKKKTTMNTKSQSLNFTINMG